MFLLRRKVSISNFETYIPNFGMHIPNFATYIPNFGIEKSYTYKNIYTIKKSLFDLPLNINFNVVFA